MWVLASDGDLMEGVASEASSLAGHQELGNLTVVYDANQISIEDDTDISFSEDVAKRYEAYGWDVVDIDWRRSPTRPAPPTTPRTSTPSSPPSRRARSRAPSRPSSRLHTVIAWPAPTARGTGKSHGSALGADEIAATKELLGFDPKKTFEVDRRRPRPRPRGEEARQGRPPGVEQAVRRVAQGPTPSAPRCSTASSTASLPDGFEKALPVFPADAKGTGDARGIRQGARRPRRRAARAVGWLRRPRRVEQHDDGRRASFIPKGKQTHEWKGGPYGRTLHFGIRENAMGMILNGIALEGLTRPYGGTFLVFSDYMRPAVRLAAIQQIPVTYVWTHDSIGLGEDGPTHQPIEHLAALRAMPGPGRRAPGRRQRDRAGVGRDPAPRPPGRPGPVPPEPPDRRPHRARQGDRRRQGRLRAHRRGLR